MPCLIKIMYHINQRLCKLTFQIVYYGGIVWIAQINRLNIHQFVYSDDDLLRGGISIIIMGFIVCGVRRAPTRDCWVSSRSSTRHGSTAICSSLHCSELRIRNRSGHHYRRPIIINTLPSITTSIVFILHSIHACNFTVFRNRTGWLSTISFPYISACQPP